MLTSDNLIKKMLESFPCLKNDFEGKFDPVEQTLLHVIFGQLFKPYIKSIFSSVESNTKREISSFLELMATTSDNAVIAVLTDTLIEELLDTPAVFGQMEPYLGANTLSYARGVKKGLGYILPTEGGFPD